MIATRPAIAPLPAMPMSIVLVFRYMTATARDHAGRRGQVGDDDDFGEAAADRAEGRARVEPEPAEPEDQHAEADQRHRVPRDRPRLAVFRVLADPRAEQQQRREGPGRADQVDHRGAGEVLHADVDLQPAAAEDPVAEHRVEDGAEDDRVDHVGAELDPLQGGAPDDRQRDRAEHELEEHERGRADRIRLDERDALARFFDRGADVEEEPVRPRRSSPSPPKASAKPTAQ